MTKKKQPITITHPQLLQEWDYEKNTLGPENYTYGSNKRVWWKCKQGHSWETMITSRASKNKRGKGSKCPKCAGRIPIVGYNDLATLRPDLTKIWDYEKNSSTPEKAMITSKKTVWWKCELGHSFKTRIDNKVNFSECQICCGRKSLEGYNDLATTHPHLAMEWNWVKNDLAPENYTINSGKKVWWKCSIGHEWMATIKDRSKSKKCPTCSGWRAKKGFNDLGTTHPELIKEWDWEKNTISPYEIRAGSHKKIWWKCEKGHEWKTSVYNRVKYRELNCTICSNNKILPGFNDLATTHPHLLQEWDYGNNNILPTTVFAKGDEIVSWKCKQGHIWKAPCSRRASGKQSGCKKCSRSGGETMLHQFIESFVKNRIIVGNRKIISPYELDIVIPELNLAFEYNGEYWHSEEQVQKSRGMSANDYHQMKTDMCKEQGIELHHIWESDWINNKQETKDKIKRIILDKIKENDILKDHKTTERESND